MCPAKLKQVGEKKTTLRHDCNFCFYLFVINWKAETLTFSLIRANQLNLKSSRSSLCLLQLQNISWYSTAAASPLNHVYSHITINLLYLWVRLNGAVMESYFLFDRYHLKSDPNRVIKMSHRHQTYSRIHII